MNREPMDREFTDQTGSGNLPQGHPVAEAILVKAQFEERLRQLMKSYGLRNPKRDALVSSICAMVRDVLDPKSLSRVLDECRAQLEWGRERERAGKAVNAAAVSIRMLEDYVATGQMVLFPLAKPLAKPTVLDAPIPAPASTPATMPVTGAQKRAALLDF